MTESSPAPNLFVARQPIFDRQLHVYAYELLFRSGAANVFPDIEGTQASMQVIGDGVVTHGLQQLTGGKPAFINFTRDLLVDDYWAMLPSEHVVVELLEDIAPDDDVLDACRRLRAEGYTLALDDVLAVDDRLRAFEQVASIVKVDFRDATAADRRQFGTWSREHPIKLLAEKVESQEEFSEGCGLGYHYFQGHFLDRPTVVPARGIAAFQPNISRLLEATSRATLDFAEVERVVATDPALSYRMLRFANAAARGLRQEVTSIRHALIMLGEAEVVQTVMLVVLSGLSADKPQELPLSAVIRASFLGSLAEDSAVLAGNKLDLFFVGMCSRLPAMLDLPMSEVVDRLPLTTAVSSALLDEPGALRDALALAAAYERADWPAVRTLSEQLKLPEQAVADRYIAAIHYADGIWEARAA